MTEDEAVAFDIVKPGFDNLMTVIRRADGARVTFAFQPGDDIERVCDIELAGWFDDDLDRSAATR
ncbi:hypothetical protein [Methylobacterium sp. J-090]|uniref:hypothetical protein n=1 Tax=Methylobacterium sp. J-090 TaxID=2836666 RepID=UPI001FBBD2C6|nr:hypothetical protein [Methylobacterium sp. J-090]MCJ2080145.1 hypothetical protein [Methylobacterium sp. J-090]